MPFSFPSNPSVGQQSLQNGRTFVWNPPAWELVAASGGGSDSRWDLFLPAAPTSLTATGGNAQADLSWTAPTVLAQTPITDYTVQYSSNSGSTWTTFSRAASTATSATVTGLTNGTAYTFRVSATNGVGVGSYSSASSSVTPAGAVITIGTQPSNQTAASGAATFSVSASVTQSASLSYQWQRSTDSGSTFAAISGATSSSLGLTGLVSGDNGYQYRVVVSATGGATSVTSSAATLTVSSGPVFSNVSWRYNPASSTFSVSGNTITSTQTSTPDLNFTIPNATLTATRTSGGQVWYGFLKAMFTFPGATQQKDGYYERAVVYEQTGGSVSNLPAGDYWFSFRRGDSNVSANFTLVLS
jgi:hypothetical protein